MNGELIHLLVFLLSFLSVHSLTVMGSTLSDISAPSF